MLDKRKGGLSILFSAVLAASLVPAPALAEMVDAIEPAEGEALVDQAQEPLDEQNATSSQEGPEEAAQSDAEQQNEDAIVNDVQGAELDAEAPVVDVQDDNDAPEAQEIVLDEPLAVAVEEGKYWVGSFTAPEANAYVFQSEGPEGEYVDTYGELYADAELTEELASDDDSAGNGGFKIMTSLEEGETVYLKAFGYDNSAASFVVSVGQIDTYDLANGSIYFPDHESMFVVGELPDPIVEGYGSEGLVESVDYELKYYDSDEGEDLDSAPTTAGSYAVRAVAVEGGRYRGETDWSWFTLYEANDLVLATIRFPGRKSVFVVGDLPDPIVEGYDSEELQEGVDYKLEFSEEDSEVILDSVPTTAGRYAVRAVAIEGGQYQGETDWARFTLYEDNDLAFATIYFTDHGDYDYVFTVGDLPDPIVEGYDSENLKEGVDYELKYYDSDEDKDLVSAPSTEGRYAVRAVAIEGGRYQGETDWAWFTLVEASDLANGSIYFPYYETLFVVDELPDPIVEGYDSEELQEGVDYKLEFSEEDSEVILDSAPTTAGTYAVRAVAVEGGRYQGFTAWRSFTLFDANDLAFATIYLSSYRIAVGERPDCSVEDGDSEELQEGVDYKLEFSEEDSEVILDSAPTTAGSYAVRAVAVEGGNYQGCTDWCSFEVIEANDLTLATMRLGSWDEAEYEFSSRAVVLNERVVDHNGTALKAGTHYTLEYYDEDNEEDLTAAPTAVGWYSVRAVATANGGYTGSTGWYSFDIRDSYDISSSWAYLNDYAYHDEEDQPVYQYKGSAVKPTVTVEMRKTGTWEYTELVEGVDYTLAYANNTRVTRFDDSATVTIRGKGKYRGSAELHFVIAGKLSISEYFDDHSASLCYNGIERYVYNEGQPGDYSNATFLASEEGVTPEVVFSGSSAAPIAGTDYTVSYIDAEGESINAPREVGYYAAVVTAKGSTYEGSVTLPFELVATKYVGEDAEFKLGYTGDVEQKGTGAWNVYSTFDVVKGIGVTIFDGAKALKEGLDYAVQKIVDETNGFVQFIFSGEGQYEDSVSAYVYAKGVRLMDISNAEVTVAKTSYTGKAQTPRVTVKATGGRTVRGTVYTTGTFTLVEGTDYTVTYSNNVNAGNKATVTITAKESAGLTGTATKTFTIDKAASSVSLSAQNATYTGKAIAYTGKVSKSGSKGAVTYKYYSDAACKKEVAAANVKAAGVYYVKGFLAADANYAAAVSGAAKLTVAKAANPMKVSAVKRTAKAAKVKSKKQTVAAPLKFGRKATGKVTYAKVAKGSAKCLTVNKKNGKVTVAKGTKKGTYKVKIKVTAAGNGNYNKASKTIACEVVVK